MMARGEKKEEGLGEREEYSYYTMIVKNKHYY